ncbi:unnamed protein product [Amoebophrya sp. A120]|nr:unnamed protein product [Amoebophrya sp. A120]|eukprot:GSA120T00001868001.1
MVGKAPQTLLQDEADGNAGKRDEKSSPGDGAGAGQISRETSNDSDNPSSGTGSTPASSATTTSEGKRPMPSTSGHGDEDSQPLIYHKPKLVLILSYVLLMVALADLSLNRIITNFSMDVLALHTVIWTIFNVLLCRVVIFATVNDHEDLRAQQIDGLPRWSYCLTSVRAFGFACSAIFFAGWLVAFQVYELQNDVSRTIGWLGDSFFPDDVQRPIWTTTSGTSAADDRKNYMKQEKIDFFWNAVWYRYPRDASREVGKCKFFVPIEEEEWTLFSTPCVTEPDSKQNYFDTVADFEQHVGQGLRLQQPGGTMQASADINFGGGAPARPVEDDLAPIGTTTETKLGAGWVPMQFFQENLALHLDYWQRKFYVLSGEDYSNYRTRSSLGLVSSATSAESAEQRETLEEEKYDMIRLLNYHGVIAWSFFTGIMFSDLSNYSLVPGLWNDWGLWFHHGYSIWSFVLCLWLNFQGFFWIVLAPPCGELGTGFFTFAALRKGSKTRQLLYRYGMVFSNTLLMLMWMLCWWAAHLHRFAFGFFLTFCFICLCFGRDYVMRANLHKWNYADAGADLTSKAEKKAGACLGKKEI